MAFGVLARLERGKALSLVAEVDGKVIASSDISLQNGYEKHVGVVGIVVKGASGTWASERL